MAERKHQEQARLLRRAILTSISEVPAVFNAVPSKYVYIPPRHIRALDPDAMLVTGIRGAGKSFWWHALQIQHIRDEILERATDVSCGFGQGLAENWPDRDELQSLLREGCEPRLIWKGVVLRQVAPGASAFTSWREWTEWIKSNPGPVATHLRKFDLRLATEKRLHIVLFDALDRTADSREDRERLLSGLLQLVLELRSLRAVRAKVFARPDMLEGPLVRGFPDASKVLASTANLEWQPLDLYGLFFQYLGNADDVDGAQAFRRLAEKYGGSPPNSKADLVWLAPKPLRSDEQRQQAVFEAIAGPYMGTNSRRGKTFKWVPNHLADGLNAVSPRSFLAALRKAAEEPVGPDHDFALHWSGLQEGVRYASKTRVDEIQEDLPWAHEAMRLLENVVVPCERSLVLSAWRKGALLKQGLPGLPNDHETVMAELRRAGILKVLPDERLNIPDVYRLGFGLRRKGGFAPKRS